MMPARGNHRYTTTPQTTEAMLTEITTASANRLAIMQDSGREVLLVGLKSAYLDKPQYQKALRAAWQRYHEIDHPNIIRYVDQRTVDGFGPAIAMEWEEARSLNEYLQESHSDEEKKNIVRQTAAALGVMHQQKLVHGAVTPATIFITRQGDRVKLLCFQLCYADRMHEPQHEMKYRAPEAKDGTVTLDERSDIYSLGILTRDLGLTAYQDLIKQATQTGRAQRYADTSAFVAALDHRHTKPAKTRSVSGSQADANKRIAVFISFIVALVIVAIIVLWNRLIAADDAALAQVEGTEAVESSEGSADATADSAPLPAQTTNHAAEAMRDKPNYSGELVFLNDLLPQMYIDIDKIYAKAKSKADARHRVRNYYKGLRRAISPKNDTQMAAFDKEFAQYVNQKNSTE